MSDHSSTRITRRRLLKGAVAAGAAFAIPQIIPSSALGRDGAVAPSERIVMGRASCLAKFLIYVVAR